MTIVKKYVQGIDNKEIFGNIGSWLTNKKVHDELGMAITSQDGDIWYISFLNNVVTGFALYRKTKSTNAIHVRFVYGAPNEKEMLVKKIIEDAKNENIKTVWTNDRKSEAVWKKLKFKFTPRNRGEFGRWEREIKKGGKR